MNEPHAQWVLLVGLTIVLSSVVRAGCARAGVPSALGMMLLGLAAGLADARVGLFSPPSRTVFDFLADLGIVALLFKVGLDSRLAQLLRALPRALWIWLGEVLASGAVAFVAARHGLGLALVPSLVVAVALSATSIGLVVTLWRDAGRLDTREGRLMLDVAELDDISGVMLLAMLLAVAPLLLGDDPTPWPAALAAAGGVLLRLALFTAGCLVFARFLEPRATALALRLKPRPARMITVAGIGFMIAALAEAMGFSLAIGALFAGLVFSRDPAAVRVEAGLDDIEALLVPFFFVGVGLGIDADALRAGLAAGALLSVAAIAGKLLGGALPARAFLSGAGALAIGLSLVPRAEVTLYAAHTARAAGDGVLPADAYAAVVVVVFVTGVLAAALLRPALCRTVTPHGARR